MYGAATSVAAPPQFQDVGPHSGTGAGGWHAQSVWHPSAQFMHGGAGIPGCRASLAVGPYPEWGAAPVASSSSAHPSSTSPANAPSNMEVQNSSVSESRGSLVQQAAASTSGGEAHPQSPPPGGGGLQGAAGGESKHSISQASPNFASHSSGSPTATPTPGYLQHGQPHAAGELFSKYPVGYSPNTNGLNPELGPSASPDKHGMGVHPDSMGGHQSYGHDMDEAQSPSSPLLHLSPPPSNRPQPARSPFEWMKKPSYQSQPDKSGTIFFLSFHIYYFLMS